MRSIIFCILGLTFLFTGSPAVAMSLLFWVIFFVITEYINE